MASSSLSQITLLQWYYKFLSLSMFFDHCVKTDDSIKVAESIRIPTGETTAMMLNTSMITKILAEIRQHPDKKNIFWYLSTISALRWVFSCMKDFMQSDRQFDAFLKELLGDQFPSFQKILYFCRNVLSHHITADIVLTREDHEKQMLMLHNTKQLSLTLNYKAIFGAVWKGKESYGFTISMDTKDVKEWQKYTSLISWHEQRMLAELCYNLSEYYRAKKVAKLKAPTIKPAPQTPTPPRPKPSRKRSPRKRPAKKKVS